MTIRALTVSFLLFAPVAFWAGAEPVTEPAGYRHEEYRAPVPSSLSGATVIDTYTTYALWLTGQLSFVDVMPQVPRPDGLPAGTIWRDKPRDTIPGAIWLPDVGYGELADPTIAYFRAGLEQASKGRLDFPLVFFCLSECWMSWNAAKRALSYGYSRVFWFGEGTDFWSASGYELERVKPWPDPASNR